MTAQKITAGLATCEAFAESLASEGRTSFEQFRDRATTFIEQFDWVKSSRITHVGMVHEGILAIFLCRIAPARADIPEELWLVVGDLPPAYLATDDAPDPASALDAYIGAMGEWVDAVRTGRPTADLIPVNAPAEANWAEMLDSRLKFLDTRILSQYRP